MKKLTKAQIKKLTKSSIPTETAYVNVDDESIAIEVKKTCTLEDRANAVSLVMDSVFRDSAVTGEASVYVPSNRDFAINVALLRYFCDIPVVDDASLPPEQQTANTISALVENRALMSAVKSKINTDFLSGIREDVDAAIDFRQKQLCAMGVNELAKIAVQSEKMIEMFNDPQFVSAIESLGEQMGEASKITEGLYLV